MENDGSIYNIRYIRFSIVVMMVSIVYKVSIAIVQHLLCTKNIVE